MMTDASSKTHASLGRTGRVFRRVLFVVLLVGFGATAMFLQSRRLTQIQQFRPYVDSLYMPRTEYAKALAFGYDTTLADFLFIRSIQAFGGQWRQGVKDVGTIYHFFDTMAELDPHFIEAFEFGSLVLGDTAKDFKGAIDLNSKGWFQNKDKYRLAYLNAYSAWWNMNDEKLARYWVKMALTSPDCPDFVRRFFAFFDRESGRYETAYEKWVWEYIKAQDENNSQMLDMAEHQISNIVREWQGSIFTKALIGYRQRNNGELPSDFDMFFYSGSIMGCATCYTERVMPLLERGRPIGVNRDEWSRRIVEATTGPLLAIPTPPYTSNYPEIDKDCYFIRKDVPADLIDKVVAEGEMIKTRKEAYEMMRGQILPYVRKVIMRFIQKNGRFPQTLDEAFKDKTYKGYDLMTGTLDYYPQTGAAYSPAFPNL
jgi:hypothetical protein